MKHRWTRFALLIALGALSMALLAACGGDEDTDTGSEGTGATATEEATGEGGASTVTATLTEFAIALDADSAAAGEVTFESVNDGALPHELAIVRSDAASGDLPQEGAVVDESQIEIVARTSEIAADGNESLTANLEAGNYVLICNIAGHYAGGMHTSFTVN